MVSLTDSSCVSVSVSVSVSACVGFDVCNVQLMDTCTQCANKRLRVIHAGKILTDATVLKDAGIGDNTVVHVAATGACLHSAGCVERVPHCKHPCCGAVRQCKRRTQNLTPPFACPPLSPCSELKDAPPTCSAGPPGGDEPPRGGFDRLRDAGLDEEQVSTLRSHFFAQVIELAPAFPRLDGEEESTRLARMEDEWMRRQPRMSEFAINIRPLIDQARAQGSSLASLASIGAAVGGVGAAAGAGAGAGAAAGGAGAAVMEVFDSDPDGPWTDAVWGVFLGFFLGFLTLVWIFSEHVSAKQRLGAMVGIFLNMCLSVMRAHSGVA